MGAIDKRSESPTETELGAASREEEAKPIAPTVKTDAVFGELNGDGPDFRSVSVVGNHMIEDEKLKVDRMDHVGHHHDQNNDGSWSPLYSGGVRHAGPDSWNYLPYCNRTHYDMVECTDSAFQN